MHVATHTALIVAALAASGYLVLLKGERLFPVIALVVAAIEAALAFHVLGLSLSVVRIDVVLPAALSLAGAVCWWRASGKGAIAASTVVVMVGALQLFTELHVLR